MMILHLFFCIILMFIFSPVLSVSNCILKVTQPQELLFGRLNQSISISCHVNMSCPNKKPKDVLWYVFKTDSYYQLDINNQSMKYTLQEADLHINWLSHSDDGVYHCAASEKDSMNSGAQDIGNGTTLTVKDYNAGKLVLITLVVLLSLYILIILTLFIFTKKRGTLSKGRQSRDKGGSTRRVHFGAVVQELYSKRNLQKNKKNMSTEVSRENKVENLQSHSEREDVYQNLKRAR